MVYHEIQLEEGDYIMIRNNRGIWIATIKLTKSKEIETIYSSGYKTVEKVKNNN